MTNPLTEASKLPFGAVAFDQIKVEHFVPALEAACARARARVEAIKSDDSPATFSAVIERLEAATAEVEHVAYAYGNLRAAHGDAAMHALAKEMMPRLAQLESDFNLDERLFARVQEAYNASQSETLSPEQRTLAEKTFRSFRRGGALLPAEKKQRLRAIDAELSTLGPEFSENVLKATNAFELVLTDKSDLAGLPASVADAAHQQAKERGKSGAWLFTLHAPSLIPFLRYSERRELRRQVWFASSSRSLSGATSNQDVLRRIVRLRHERASLLGYPSHAHYQLEERMAEDPRKVRAFLQRLLEKSRPAAEKEMADLRAFMRQQGEHEELMPWDYSYWSNRLKEHRFQINAEELKPYFSLESVLQGAFAIAGRLYGLTFREVTNVPTYAPDVRVFAVADAAGQMGLFYTDFYPRSTKSQGAWCTRYHGQWQDQLGMHRPHVSIVCNFTQPTASSPALLTFQEVTTLFHEFGHALHSLLSRCRYRSLACTSVYRDFVELPSQIMENWAREPEGLALFAKHYETGADIPPDLVKRVVASENFHAAYAMMRQLRFAMLDLAWYSGDPGTEVDIPAFELAAVQATDLLPNVPGTNISCAFEHIFSGGYSAGYYGYKWAEVLDADAFECFKGAGIFSRDIAGRFRKSILERGGSEHPMRLYQEFRGRPPDPDALLRRSGLA